MIQYVPFNRKWIHLGKDKTPLEESLIPHDPLETGFVNSSFLIAHSDGLLGIVVESGASLIELRDAAFQLFKDTYGLVDRTHE